MLGWINDCVEKLVVEKFGLEAWHIVKQKAGCSVPDNEFFKLDHYSDKSTIDLVVAASEVSGMSVDEVLEAFGVFFVHYIRNEGYDNLLCCQGSTLKDWMSNINAIHHHLQTTFPKKMIMPQFWCEDDDSEEDSGALVLHYHSRRGNHLAPLAKGLVGEIATFQFKVDINMERLRTQDVDGAKFTSWKVTAKDPKDQWKLTQKEASREGVNNMPTTFKCPFSGITTTMPAKSKRASAATATASSEQPQCPVTATATADMQGIQDAMLGCPLDDSDCASSYGSDDDSAQKKKGPMDGTTAPLSPKRSSLPTISAPLKDESTPGSTTGRATRRSRRTTIHTTTSPMGLPRRTSGSKLMDLSTRDEKADFYGGPPSLNNSNAQLMDGSQQQQYGTTRTEDDPSVFKRTSTGGATASISDSETDSLSDDHMPLLMNNVGISADVIKDVHPYHIVMDHHFTIIQVGKKLAGCLCQADDYQLIGRNIDTVLEVIKPMGMNWNWNWLRLMEDQPFDLAPVDELVEEQELEQNATRLSMVKFQTTIVHISDSPPMAMLILTPAANNLGDLMDMQLTLSDLPVHGAHRDAIFLREHLSTQMNNALKMEKLSRSLEREKNLLHSLLPTHAAEGLRKGETVEPMLHNNVTFFFSDVVGFTSICDQIYPWEVIAMLNRLYSVMDYLAKKFNLYKVETIGDAYVCCSGLPETDENHAQNVANFALAVQHCTQLVVSPVDQAPIQLRIGIHTGSCASGVVGMTNPRYCVFGDTVNTCARHESSGLPGKIHTSSATERVLTSLHPNDFAMSERGLVPMKGKGDQFTYWLDSSTMVNHVMLEQLEVELKELLNNSDFAITCKPRLTKQKSRQLSILSMQSMESMESMENSTSNEEKKEEGVATRQGAAALPVMVVPKQEKPEMSPRSEEKEEELVEDHGAIMVEVHVSPILADLTHPTHKVTGAELDYFYFM